jgi:hypothetical protein
MLDLQTAQNFGWGLSILLRAFLLCLLLFRGNIRSFPLFAAYLVASIAKGLLTIFAYDVWGMKSLNTYWVAWGSQALVISTRALAVAELCWLLLGRYRGIWSFTWRILLTCAGIIFLYSAIFSDRTWEGAIIGAERSLELAMASVIVLLFVFLRHYEVVLESSLRSLAVGFCVYSCIVVLNFTILQRFMDAYVPVWNLLEVFSYLACLLAWTWALRKRVPRPIFEPALVSNSVYREISPEINARLRALNDQLSQFWRTEAPRP